MTPQTPTRTVERDVASELDHSDTVDPDVVLDDASEEHIAAIMSEAFNWGQWL